MNLQVSYNWIKEYVNYEGKVEDFAKEFSLKSQTIDRFVSTKPKFKGIITAKILDITKHPNADKLQIAKVEAGKTKPTVVCGAPNIKVGQIVPLAVVGAQVIDPDGNIFKIKKAKIRDVESNGMLCSQKELGLGDEHTGIMILPSKTQINKPLEEVLNLQDDYNLEIEVTSNRPDAMSVVGLAREAAAALGVKDKIKVPKPNMEIKVEEKSLSVEVLEPKLCPRYQAIVMTDVKVGPSPIWMQMRLIASGMRPINNLVDITNYLILEYGRPMHVFDYDKIQGQKIIVRHAKLGEKILALDGQTYKLKPEHLVIADAKEPVAVAGIMGGELTAATEKTKTIIFECAAFDPVLIRKTARELNLHSDSSDMFEKNLHPETTFVGMLRAIELTKKIAGGKVASPIIDSYATDYKSNKIKFDTSSVKRHLGVEISVDNIKNILELLGFEVSGQQVLNVIVPYWRANDVTAEHDLIEEVARIYGFHNIPTMLPQGEIPANIKDPQFFWEDKTKDILAGLGFTEVYNYSMISKELLQKVKFSEKEAIKIDNPLNEDLEYMRTTLLPQVLQNIADNQRNFITQCIFELSNIYIPIATNKLPEELPKLTGALVSENVFLKTKGVVELVLKKLGISDYGLKPTDSQCPLWEKDRCLDIYKGKKFLGQFGLVKNTILEKFDINKEVGLFDFDFLSLTSVATTVKSFQDIPEFPAVTRDLAIIVDKKLNWQEVLELVSQSDKLIFDVKYLSTFTDESIGAGKKSLALRMVFRSNDRTLKSEEVDQIVGKVISKLEKNFEANLR